MPNSDTTVFSGRQGFQNLTQENLVKFKKLINMPDDEKLQNLTIEELIEYSKSKSRDGSNAEAASDNEIASRFPPVTRISPPTPCQKAVATAVMDAFFLALGAVGIRSKVKQAAQEIDFLKMHMPTHDVVRVIRYYDDGSLLNRGWAVYRVLRVAAKAGMAAAIWGAIVKTLKWYDMVLYGVEGLAEIVAFVASDGVAAVALVAEEVARAGFFATDIMEAVEACESGSAVSHFDGEVSFKLQSAIDNNKLYVGPVSSGIHPTMTGYANLGVVLKFHYKDKNQPLMDGDTVQITTTEAATGSNTMMGYDGYGNITYAAAGSQDSNFTVHQADPKMAQASIQDGDEVIFTAVKAPAKQPGNYTYYIASTGSGITIASGSTPWLVHSPDPTQ
jgi:hypothetical protein